MVLNPETKADVDIQEYSWRTKKCGSEASCGKTRLICKLSFQTLYTPVWKKHFCHFVHFSSVFWSKGIFVFWLLVSSFKSFIPLVNSVRNPHMIAMCTHFNISWPSLVLFLQLKTNLKLTHALFEIHDARSDTINTALFTRLWKRLTSYCLFKLGTDYLNRPVYRIYYFKWMYNQQLLL